MKHFGLAKFKMAADCKFQNLNYNAAIFRSAEIPYNQTPKRIYLTNK